MIVIAASIPALNTWRYVSEVMRIRILAFNYLATTLIAATVGTTVLGVLGVLALGWRVEGVFFAGLVGNLAAAAYGVLGLVRSGLTGRFSRPELKRILRLRPAPRSCDPRRLGIGAGRANHPLAPR